MARTARLRRPQRTPADQFAEVFELPKLQSGDLGASLSAGADGLSYSPTGFFSHATPAEFLLAGGKLRVFRSRGRPQDARRGHSNYATRARQLATRPGELTTN